MVEGLREITLALESGFEFRYLMICEEIAREADILGLERLNESTSEKSKTEWLSLSRKVYEHLAHRKTTEGVIGIASSRERSLESLTLGNNPLVLVAEASEKPGNIGALPSTRMAAPRNGQRKKKGRKIPPLKRRLPTP